MKVLILTESADRSRYWEAALPILRSRNIDAWFAALRTSGAIMPVLEKKGIPTLAFGAESSSNYPSTFWRLVKLLKAEKFDVVHASEAIQSTIAGMACLFVNTKCVFHYHHTYVTGMQSRYSFTGSKLSDVVMAVSRSSQQATIKNDGTPVRKTFVAYNGIDPLREVSEGENRELRRRLNVPDSAKLVTVVARLREEKGHRTLFDACRIATAAIREPLHLVVVGDGEERAKLVNESSKFVEFKTHFVGHQDDVAQYYSAADVVAMPSYFEPFGLVAVEAMVCGKALVASNVEGPAEIIENGISGILVPPKDAAALSDALVKVFDSPEWAREIGENARKRVLEKFTMETMVESWIDCYKSVLDRPGNNN